MMEKKFRRQTRQTPHQSRRQTRQTPHQSRRQTRKTPHQSRRQTISSELLGILFVYIIIWLPCHGLANIILAYY